MDRYWVVGNPISHSLSPSIHKAFALQTGQELVYEACKLEPEEFSAQLKEQLLSGKIQGANVTLPFKESAWQLAEIKTERAQLAGAVNTVYLDSQGRINGDNTDGPGLVADLSVHNHLDLSNSKILVLGAGGAVRGVLRSLLDCSPSKLVLANRTVEKAQLLAELCGDKRVTPCFFDDIPKEPFDLIVNGTSASLSGQVPAIAPQAISSQTVAYDMMYGKETTAFCAWAQKQGAKTIDGLGMLVEQAAESFFIWRSVRPETAPVLAKLRADLSRK